jgi:hypothetical protein
MKEKIISFIHQLIVYDYFLFGGIFVLFLLLLVLAIAFKDKLGVAVFLVFLAFGVLTLGSVAGYIALHNYLFQHQIIVREVKALQYTEALLVKGEVHNRSQRPFSECTLTVGVHKVTHNPYLDRIYPNLPFTKSSLRVTEAIKPGESATFKLFVEPFRYSNEYNITIKGNCR